ncbi:MAG TPA: phosphate acetyltransferase [Ignavibacteriales bacterium]|nr:phosphate acetyltransferase [Ignavibacteriales bacterium]HOL82257.1 phosphate acetyltransferase [Ignavibacteriales bacterium]HOM66257.1 phosphate acetyltransferase [Ignavibacteriales bacterium]HPD67109.1 phosphate acetyltransferase [Ignavibacteriales bacterium]HPP34472.1 phosphate acetyltransferase [Ignavibacteriales bacterium]
MSSELFLKELRKKAASRKKSLILPESHDIRVLKALEIVVKEGIAASVMTIGDEEKLRKVADENNIDLKGVRIINPEKSEKLSDFTNLFYNQRKQKGKEMPIEEVRELMKRDIFFAAMMIKEGMVDASVSGSTATTADVMRASFWCVGLDPQISIASSFFLMLKDHETYAFGDCAVNPNPTAEQLADIAINTADNFKKLTDLEPKVAMLSFSTKGSAEHELVDKVRQATELVKSKRPDIMIDGELQFDAAYVPEVGKKKAPHSKVAGNANVYIFPDLQAGNIGYKIAQRLGGFEAVGPVSQGLKRPFFDLSRGCSVDDIVNTAAIALMMA